MLNQTPDRKINSHLERRTDYTFKFNSDIGRHGWLRLTPAYSVKLVRDLLENFPKKGKILDPFSGTATTGLVAAEKNHRAITLDINPFLIWLGNIKCRNYSFNDLALMNKKAKKVLSNLKKYIRVQNWTPNIFNIERWWSSRTLNVLAALRESIVNEFGEPKDNLDGGIAWVAFSRLVIETSSAAFNHVSMSFSNSVTHYDVEHIATTYYKILEFILNSCQKNIPGSSKTIFCDARNIKGLGVRFDGVITSPPYPNRISYIRELRPYMYWLKFLEESREAAEMDWKAIGGTWGVATSRLNTWQPQVTNLPHILFEVVEKIAKSKEKNSDLLANYVLKYFHDMHIHFLSLQNVLKDGAKLNYIVGNSTFYGIMVYSPEIISASLKQIGYSNINYGIIRKRNCKKSLYEFNISAIFGS